MGANIVGPPNSATGISAIDRRLPFGGGRFFIGSLVA
jgi:hypothetical protein